MKFNIRNMLIVILVATLINSFLASVGTPSWIQMVLSFLIGFNSKHLGLPITQIDEDNKNERI